jgi:hypothetical protein
MAKNRIREFIIIITIKTENNKSCHGKNVSDSQVIKAARIVKIKMEL